MQPSDLAKFFGGGGTTPQAPQQQTEQPAAASKPTKAHPIQYTFGPVTFCCKQDGTDFQVMKNTGQVIPLEPEVCHLVEVCKPPDEASDEVPQAYPYEFLWIAKVEPPKAGQAGAQAPYTAGLYRRDGLHEAPADECQIYKFGATTGQWTRLSQQQDAQALAAIQQKFGAAAVSPHRLPMTYPAYAPPRESEIEIVSLIPPGGDFEERREAFLQSVIKASSASDKTAYFVAHDTIAFPNSASDNKSTAAAKITVTESGRIKFSDGGNNKAALTAFMNVLSEKYGSKRTFSITVTSDDESFIAAAVEATSSFPYATLKLPPWYQKKHPCPAPAPRLNF